MTAVTRDTRTDVTPIPGMDADLDDLDPRAVALPELDRFDPTRVRLTGLRAAEWRAEASCSGKATRDRDDWHPGPVGERAAPTAQTRQICRDCPVRVECLALGLALLPLGDVWGVWAGYTDQELRAIAKARGMEGRTVAQHGTRARRVAGCDCAPCRRAHAEYVAELRAQERYAESDRFERQVSAALPTPEPTDTPIPDLFALLAQQETA